MTEIKDYDIYNERMGASMKDKLFFLDMLDPKIDTIVDFGCADATMYLELRKKEIIYDHEKYSTMENMDKYLYIGIEKDEAMRVKASERTERFKPRPSFYSSIDSLLSNKTFRPERTAILLSSVVHEIAHYEGWDKFIELMTSITNAGFKQVIIRDMAVSDIYYHTGADVPITISNNPAWLNFIISRGYNEDSVITENILTEFLLKYRYVENWARERDEKYFPCSMENLNKFYDNMLKHYELTYANHVIHRYTADSVEYDWHIKLKVPTHYKKVYTLI